MSSTTTSRQKEGRSRSWWFDPRFAIGLGLVVVSVLGALALVSAADTSVQVVVARSALSPGDRIDEGDLVIQSVRLDGAETRYRSSDEVPDAGFVVTRAVSAGELVPASAVGNPAGVRLASVVVSVQSELARSIAAGASVDLWSAHETENGVFGPPAVLVSSATVVRVVQRDGIIADRGGASVEVLVPRTKIARVLEAIANQDAISLVPMSIPVKG
jgi:hypothetical protein